MGRILSAAFLVGLAFGLAGCDGPEGNRRASSPSAGIPDSPTSPKNDPPPLIQPGDEPATIVDKSIQAYGGPKMLARWKVGRIKYKAKWEALGAGPDEVSVAETFQLPGRFKRSVHPAAPATDRRAGFTFVITEKEGWMRWDDGLLQPVAKKGEAAWGRHHLADLIDLEPMKSGQNKLSVDGELTVGGRRAVVVRSEGPSGDAEVCFDKATALVLKTVRQIPARLSRLGGTSTTTFDDFKDFGGGMTPTRISMTGDGKPILELHSLEAEFFDAIDDAEFAKP